MRHHQTRSHHEHAQTLTMNPFMSDDTASLRNSISVMWRADGHVTCHVTYGSCSACTVTRDDPLVDPNLAACAAGDSAARRSAMPTATDASPAACAAGDSAARCSAMPTATEHSRVSQASANHVLRSTARILSTTTLSTTTGIWSFPGPVPRPDLQCYYCCNASVVYEYHGQRQQLPQSTTRHVGPTVPARSWPRIICKRICFSRYHARGNAPINSQDGCVDGY